MCITIIRENTNRQPRLKVLLTYVCECGFLCRYLSTSKAKSTLDFRLLFMVQIVGMTFSAIGREISETDSSS